VGKSALKNTFVANLKLRFWAGLLLLFVLGSLWLVFKFVEKERDRDLSGWQFRLALLSELRQSDVQNLIDKRKFQLHQLSSNPGLALFLSLYANKNYPSESYSSESYPSEKYASENADKSALRAQQSHVRNLLAASAQHFGFVASSGAVNQKIVQMYGLAIFDAERKLLMSSKGFVKNIEKHRHYIDKVFASDSTSDNANDSTRVEVIDLYAGHQQQPVYGYVVPVFHIQGDEKKRPVGAVMVLLDPRKDLYGLLQNRQTITRTDETLLIRQSGAGLEYISPIKGGFKLFHQLPDNQHKLAASFACHQPGGFSIMKDYRGEEVLVTGRKLNRSDWCLVQKISAAEALADSNAHQQFLFTTFTLLVFIITFAFIAIWRHSTSVRLQVLTSSLEAHTSLLDAVADNIQENIFLLDENSKIIFINPIFAQSMKLDVNELQARQLSSVLGKEVADQLLCCEPSGQQDCVLALAIEDERRMYHVSTTLLKSGEFKNARLYVLHDISDLKREQEKREALSRGIIATLVKAVDLHDPFCANHSERTREVALALGREMALEAQQLESLEMASLLANIGKLFVAKDILIKMDDLRENELAELKKHVGYALEILSGLVFKGPVVDIISQKNERLDGQGYPAGLVGDEILLESKILAVANAFVAMVSSRAYREGREVNEVVDLLLGQVGIQYDRHVVAALFHIVENKAHWQSWRDISKA